MQNRNDKTLFPLLCLFGFTGQILSISGGTEGLRTERSYSAGFLGTAVTQLGKAILFFTSEAGGACNNCYGKKIHLSQKT